MRKREIKIITKESNGVSRTRTDVLVITQVHWTPTKQLDAFKLEYPSSLVGINKNGSLPGRPLWQLFRSAS